MPEFMLNAPHWFLKPRTRSEAARLTQVRDFAAGHAEAMFFTNGDSGDDDEFSLNDLGPERLTRKSKLAIIEDCRAFLNTIIKTGPDTGLFVQQIIDREPGDKEQAGRDFWFTRQGHGTGFWARDDDVWGEQARDSLTEAAKAFGETMATRERGWIIYG